MTPRRPAPSKPGFTLVELIVVMAILGIVLTLTASISEQAISLRSATKARIVSERNAAAFLRQFGSDMAQRVVRSEARARIDKHEGDDELRFLTQRHGYPIHAETADRRASLVSYRVNQHMLERAASGYGFGKPQERPAEESGTLALAGIPAEGPAAPADKSFQVIAPAIIRLEFSFLVRDAAQLVIRANPPEDQDQIEAVIATVVTLDPDRRRMLDQSMLARIAGRFADARDDELLLEKWTEVADKLVGELADVPRQALQQVRVQHGLVPFSNRIVLP